jgi:hypothetical protein
MEPLGLAAMPAVVSLNLPPLDPSRLLDKPWNARASNGNGEQCSPAPARCRDGGSSDAPGCLLPPPPQGRSDNSRARIESRGPSRSGVERRCKCARKVKKANCRGRCCSALTRSLVIVGIDEAGTSAVACFRRYELPRERHHALIQQLQVQSRIAKGKVRYRGGCWLPRGKAKSVRNPCTAEVLQ